MRFLAGGAFVVDSGVEAKVIEIRRGRLQGLMNGCFPKDPNCCVVEVKS
jgi:hypothetical protein